MNGNPNSIRAGIDMGGTKIELVALGAVGAELYRRRIETPQGDYIGILDAMVRLIADCESSLGMDVTIGVGTPGAISPASGLMKNSNTVCVNGQPFKRDLELRLGRSVRVANDANCFALSEAIDGAAPGADVVFGVIIGTGVGGGVVVHDRILSGPNAIAGEWGHNPLPWPRAEELPGPECYCGKSGCIETFLSGPGLAQDHFLNCEQALSGEEIVTRANKGDTQAQATLARYEDRLARALAHVINILDPNVIVLGGGLSNIKRLYENVPKLWGQYVFSDRVDTRLIAPKHGDSSGVRGAAWLWNE